MRLTTLQKLRVVIRVPTPEHNNAISIVGADGISVTADNGGQIKISGHEKPANLGNVSGDGVLVPKPTATDTTKYLKADGTWDKPTDTQITFKGYTKKNSNGNINTSNQLNSTGGTLDTQVVTSLVAGTSITLEHNKNTGALTIIGPASGRTIEAGIGITADDSNNSKRILNLKGATFDTVSDSNVISGLGGIKIGTGGSKQFNYTWNNPDEAETGWSASTDDIPVTVYQPNRANGKYYPVECTKDSAAVVCIPNVPSTFYEENTSDKFTFEIENYKVAYIQGQPTFAFTGDIGSGAFNISLADYNAREDIQQAGMAIAPENVEQITAKEYIGLSITCPSNVLFAQLDLPVTLPMMPTVPLMTSIQSKKIDNKQTLSILESNPAAGFTPGKTTYAYLRFTTKANSVQGIKAHTYNATVVISYKSGNYTVTPAF